MPSRGQDPRKVAARSAGTFKLGRRVLSGDVFLRGFSCTVGLPALVQLPGARGPALPSPESGALKREL